MKVSVIIPCFNAEAYLAQTIGSVLEQTQPPDEIILVDDGSTDGSLAVARRFGQQLCIVEKENEGASRARNLGAELAGGDALMFLDADDVVGPTALEALSTTLAHHTDSIAICDWYRLENVGNRWVSRPRSCRPRRPGQDDLSAWLSRWYHPPCSVLWRRNVFERTGGWDEQVVVNQDGDIMMRALVEGIPLVRADGGSAFYRHVPANEPSVSDRRYSRAGIESELYVYSKIAYLLEKRGRLGAYRSELGQAFDDLAGVCKHRYPELYARCKANARRYDRPRLVRAARRRLKAGIARATHQVVEDGNDATTEEATNAAAQEICYGHEAAQAAQRSTASPATPVVLTGLERPHVSIVLPTYNRAQVLHRALASALQQSFGDLELLVVDDGSSDHTPDVVGGCDDDRIRYFRQPRNQGVAAARNRGIRAARGAYIAFLDSDDEWVADKLEQQMNHFEKLPEDVGFVSCGAEIIEDDGTVSTFRPQHRGDVFKDLLIGNVIHSTSGVIIRRNVVRAAGFFDEDIPAIEDYDYWLRIARFYHFDYVDNLLFRYYHHGGSLRKTAEIEKNLEAYDYFFNKHRHDMKREGVTHLFFKESARRHLVAGRANRERIRPLAWRALRSKPFAYEAQRFFLSATVPHRYFQAARRMYQSARNLVTSDS